MESREAVVFFDDGRGSGWEKPGDRLWCLEHSYKALGKAGGSPVSARDRYAFPTGP